MQTIDMNISPVELGATLKNIFDTRGVSQVAIEMGTGISQSQISRIFNGHFCLSSGKNVQKLCKYAEIVLIKEPEKPVDPRTSELLMSALQDIWDGSRKQEKALARLIRNLDALVK